ncbi:MAG: DUF814 domain-containing protein [bacterium]|nr:DUF814 domain-containing protein [bacterium]
MSTPWTDHAALAGLLAGWRGVFSGRELFTVTAGRDWVRLHLAGDEKAGLLLSDVPGARGLCAVTGRLPEPLHVALAPVRRHPLRSLLDGARLDSVGMFPDDRVAAFALTVRDGSSCVLMHRLFGPRGNTVLLAGDGRLLWGRHRPPHALLAEQPPSGTWETGPAVADIVSTPYLDHLTARLANDLAQRSRARLQRVHKGVARLHANLARDLAGAGRGDEHRRRAEALAAILHTLSKGQAEIQAPDLRDGTPLVIVLDPARTPAENLEAWFRRARKADRGRALIAERLDAAAERLAELDAAATALDAATTVPEPLAALQQWILDHGDVLPPNAKPGRSPHAPDQPARPFRRYLVDGRWEVWVGRNNRENDELTHRASHVKDLWFHAQGVTGSHVILRTGGRPDLVPRAVVEKAAALAALHSKARHAGLVPVVWTERRYVRKPRKSAPGLAVCLREKSLFVEPGVAPGVATG